MEFKDFANNPQELVGKYVLCEIGSTWSLNNNKSIRKIEKVSRNWFKITDLNDAIFNLINGSRKGLNGRMNMGAISKCTLITEEQANELKLQWKQKREEKELRERMKMKLESMNFEQLKQMELI